MRTAFLIFFLLFAVLPVMMDVPFAEQVSVEIVEMPENYGMDIEEQVSARNLYIRLPELHPPRMVEKPVHYAGVFRRFYGDRRWVYPFDEL